MPTRTIKSPDPIDVYVGSRVKAQRLALGISQSGAAEKLGLTFHQLQKYEQGHNRISASKLYRLAQTLDVPTSYFFDGCDPGAAPLPKDENQPSDHEVLSLNKAYAAIQGKELRNYARRIVQVIAWQNDDGDHG